MKIISFLNIKGGVGKTTSTVNIASELARLNNKVLVIDLDPQCNSSKYIPYKNKPEANSFNILYGNSPISSICSTVYKNLYIIPALIDLVRFESKLDNEYNICEGALNNALEKLRNIDFFDYILIDCPPSLGMLSTNALVASDYVLVPVKIDNFALIGLDYLISCIEQVKAELNPGLKLLGMFITLDDNTKINKEIKNDMKEAFGDKFFNQTIRKNVDVTKSTFEQVPVYYYNKRAIAAIDYAALTKEVIECLI